MDVRCESCHTEYELDDGKVQDGGTDVQCTFCGHTFVVFPPSAAARAAAENEFLLATADGRTQRLRDLTVLQKWIIERRVTRTDKISKNGQAFVRLGALEDLAPFFDVVDEADRARAAIGRSVSSESLPARTGGGLTIPTATESAAGRTTPQGERAVNRSLELMAVEAPAARPEQDFVVAPAGPRAWWKLLVTFGVAAGVAYAGIRALPALMGTASGPLPRPPGVDRVSDLARGARDIFAGRSQEPPGVETPAPPAAPEAPAAAAPAAVPPAPEPVAPVAQIPAAPTPPTPPAPPPARSTPPAPAEAPLAKPARAVAPRTVTIAPPRARPAEDAPYDKLIAQADSLLENGQNERAFKLYQRALAVRPDAPEALTGVGYVHLDRNRVAAAIEYFNRASAGTPYAPALFGLGQAQRAGGDPARARETYRRYLSLFPTGSDASAAERQLRQLTDGESGTPASPASIMQEGNAPAAREPAPAKTPAAGKDSPAGEPERRDGAPALTPPPPPGVN